jgi:hypothetical protein
MFDWQMLTVVCVILVAALYVGRRSLQRLTAFRNGVGQESSCAGCDSACGALPVELKREARS